MTMLQTIFAWVLVAVMIAAAYPLAAWLVAQSPRRDGMWLTVMVTLALSIGTLTLIMFWEGLVGIPFRLAAIALPYFIIMAIGGWLWWRSPNRKQIAMFSRPVIPLNRSEVGIVAALVIISATILFNAAYWPFHRDDVLGIYGKYGKLMYETGTLVPFAGRDDAFYQAYPMEIPLAYTFTFVASGWEDEYLALVIPALLSLACLPAAYVLGKMLYDNRVGLMAALLLALAPTFTRWASSGYVDLPMAFFYTLAAIFAWRLRDSDHPSDAVLLGIALGLTAWTKNAGLLGLILFGLWLAFVQLFPSGKRIGWRQLSIAVGVCLLIAAPWYIRNEIEAHLIMPPTAWVGQAERTLHNIFIFVAEPGNYAITGWLIMIGLLAAVYAIIRKREEVQEAILLLTLTVPFFGAWWVLVSYDPRFLLLFLPLLTIIAANWAVKLWDAMNERWRRPAGIAIAIIALALTIYIVWISVDFKGDILHHPFMGDETKKAIVLKPNGT